MSVKPAGKVNGSRTWSPGAYSFPVVLESTGETVQVKWRDGSNGAPTTLVSATDDAITYRVIRQGLVELVVE
jgi:hypothetical protein